MGDRFFDLANFASHHDLGPDEEAALLAAYFGESTQARLAAVRLMRLMAAFWEGMWGVIQAACSELDIDYMGYADEHLAKVRVESGRPRLRDLAGRRPCRVSERFPTVPAA